MLFCLISSPCAATIAVTRSEAGSWFWAAFQFVSLTVLAYIITFAVYQIGSLVMAL
jgi:ferrous iron transport protein B